MGICTSTAVQPSFAMHCHSNKISNNNNDICKLYVSHSFGRMVSYALFAIKFVTPPSDRIELSRVVRWDVGRSVGWSVV